MSRAVDAIKVQAEIPAAVGPLVDGMTFEVVENTTLVNAIAQKILATDGRTVDADNLSFKIASALQYMLSNEFSGAIRNQVGFMRDPNLYTVTFRRLPLLKKAELAQMQRLAAAQLQAQDRAKAPGSKTLTLKKGSPKKAASKELVVQKSEEQKSVDARASQTVDTPPAPTGITSLSGLNITSLDESEWIF